MVEFCNACGTSLPKGDLTIRKGEVYTSHDYECPSCNKIANPEKKKEDKTPEPQEGQELIFKDGKVKSK